MNPGPQSGSLCVLAVDDDPVSLAVTAVLLQAQGCSVLQASSGEEALDLIATEDPAPDCVLADLRMPSLAGPELARLLRQIAPRARLFAMSANPPSSVDGYDEILRKPLTPETLEAALNGSLHRRHPASNGATVPAPAPALAPEEETPPILDPLVFDRLRRAMPLAALEEVVTAFLNDTDSRIRLMRSAPPETVRRQAHTVRGGASMVGAVQVSVAASIIEAGIDQADDRLRKLDELESHLRRAELILKQRLQP